MDMDKINLVSLQAVLIVPSFSSDMLEVFLATGQ